MEVRKKCRVEGCDRNGMSKGKGKYATICKTHRRVMRKEKKAAVVQS